MKRDHDLCGRCGHARYRHTEFNNAGCLVDSQEHTGHIPYKGISPRADYCFCKEFDENRFELLVREALSND